jgi:exopolyphosphatase/guanosine-5'-triphosphate,3'-diphosphate pyrophosphatase
MASTTLKGHIDKCKVNKFFQLFSEFKKIIDNQKPDNFKIIATNSFRNIKDKSFIKNVENILGHQINIISSDEEGYLAFRGVSSTNDLKENKYFILDIGGSSTEIIKVKENKISKIISLQIGSASLTKMYSGYNTFPYNDANDYIKSHLAKENVSEFSFKNNKAVYGTSGSFKSAYRACQILQKTNGAVIKENFRDLINNPKKIQLKNSELKNYINSYRMSLLPASLAILNCVINTINISDIYKSNGGIREGVIDELSQKT